MTVSSGSIDLEALRAKLERVISELQGDESRATSGGYHWFMRRFREHREDLEAVLASLGERRGTREKTKEEARVDGTGIATDRATASTD